MPEVYAVWDDAEARRWFARLPRRLQNLTPFMRQIGDRLMLSTRLRFEQGREPRDPQQGLTGRPWQPAGPGAPSRQRGGPPLSGRHLARPGLGYAYQARPDRLELGTRLPYGLIHHFGTVGAGGSMPDLVPTRAKALTIPYPGVTRTARSYADTFIAQATIFQRRRRGRPRPLFLLRRRVALPPRPIFGVEEGDWASIRELFRQAVLGT